MFWVVEKIRPWDSPDRSPVSRDKLWWSRPGVQITSNRAALSLSRNSSSSSIACGDNPVCAFWRRPFVEVRQTFWTAPSCSRRGPHRASGSTSLTRRLYEKGPLSGSCWSGGGHQWCGRACPHQAIPIKLHWKFHTPSPIVDAETLGKPARR